MFKAKFIHSYKNYLLAALLALLVCTQFFAVSHNFSHHINFGIESTKGDAPLKHTEANCVWSFVNNFQQQIVLAAAAIFIASYFSYVFAPRKFARVKASYLLSSKAPRAPPVIS